MNTIKTAFFPFTFISEKWASACWARFGQVLVYQPASGAAPEPMEDLAAEGKILLQYPAKGDDQNLIKLARQFQGWGQVHHKHAAALKPFAEAGFYNQEFAPEISTEILKGGREEPPRQDPLFTARLFLLMAQEYDRQASELEIQLGAAQHAAMEMFAGIRGQPEESESFHVQQFSAAIPDRGGSGSEDPGAYMPEARIRAWQCLAGADPEAPRLWLTSSPAVIEVLNEHFEPLTAMDSLPENVRAGLPRPREPLLEPGAVFYEMSSSGHIIGLLPYDDDVNKKSDHAP